MYKIKMKKKTKQDYINVWSKFGFKWTATELPKDSTKKTTWECKNNHLIETSYSKITSNFKCKKCGGKNMRNMNDYISLANEYEGKWLGTEIVNVRTKTTWRCKYGNIFEKEFDTIRVGHWCQCRDCNKHNHILEETDYIDLATKKGVLFVGPFPKNSKEKTYWKCSKEHLICNSFDAMRDETAVSCSVCAHIQLSDRKRSKFEDYIKAGEEKGFPFLECQNTPEKNNVKCKWTCDVHGVFLLSLNKLKLRGCQKCRIKNRDDRHRLTFGNYVKMGEIREYTFLECQIVPQRNDDKCKWFCEEHGYFMMTYHLLQKNEGCYKCSKFKTENVCRDLIQNNIKIITGIPYLFEKIRPKWLKIGERSVLELDGYCEMLNIAFEYQGIQHYKFIDFFHKTQEGFEKLQERDRKKRELILQKNIIFFEIPYTLSYKNKAELDCFIYNFLLEALNKKVKFIFE
jgi:hypothetical protein